MIDAHVHAWSPDAPLDPGRDYTPVRPFPIAALIERLDVHRIAGAVLVQPSFLGTDNRCLLDALARHPARLRGVAVVAPETDAAALDRLRRAGVAGVRFNLAHGDVPDLTRSPWPAFMGRLAGAGLHLQLHGPAPLLRPAVSAALAAGPSLVVDHFGRPDPAHGSRDPDWRWLIDALADGPHHVKLSAPYRLSGLDPRALAAILLDRLGPGRLVWGSDCPWTRFEAGRDYAECVRWLTDWVPAAEPRRLVADGTARHLYGFDRD